MTDHKKLCLTFSEEQNQIQKIIIPVYLEGINPELLAQDMAELIEQNVLLKGRKRNRRTTNCLAAQTIETTIKNIY